MPILSTRLGHMAACGVRCMYLLALSDSGNPSYEESLARKLAAMGIPCFACTPNRLPEMLEGALRGMDLKVLAERIASKEQLQKSALPATSAFRERSANLSQPAV